MTDLRQRHNDKVNKGITVSPFDRNSDRRGIKEIRKTRKYHAGYYVGCITCCADMKM